MLGVVNITSRPGRRIRDDFGEESIVAVDVLEHFDGDCGVEAGVVEGEATICASTARKSTPGTSNCSGTTSQALTRAPASFSRCRQVPPGQRRCPGHSAPELRTSVLPKDLQDLVVRPRDGKFSWHGGNLARDCEHVAGFCVSTACLRIREHFVTESTKDHQRSRGVE